MNEYLKDSSKITTLAINCSSFNRFIILLGSNTNNIIVNNNRNIRSFISLAIIAKRWPGQEHPRILIFKSDFLFSCRDEKETPSHIFSRKYLLYATFLTSDTVRILDNDSSLLSDCGSMPRCEGRHRSSTTRLHFYVDTLRSLAV